MGYFDKLIEGSPVKPRSAVPIGPGALPTAWCNNAPTSSSNRTGQVCASLARSGILAADEPQEFLRLRRLARMAALKRHRAANPDVGPILRRCTGTRREFVDNRRRRSLHCLVADNDVPASHVWDP
jgi:hypothetical protein